MFLYISKHLYVRCVFNFKTEHYHGYCEKWCFFSFAGVAIVVIMVIAVLIGLMIFIGGLIFLKRYRTFCQSVTDFFSN